MANAPPSMNPADKGSLIGSLKFMMWKQLQNTDDMLPAKVISYDRATNRAMVQPLIAVVTTLSERIDRAQIASVPVLQLGGGGFVLSFPIIPGDIGWIKSNDRDISNFKRSLTNTTPNTQRQHSFEDSIFIPDSMMRQVVINDDDADSVVIQSIDGTQRVAISATQVTITSDTLVKIDSPLTEITGQIIGGTNPSYDRTATFNGDITTTGDVVGGSGSGNVSLNTHTHDGVQPGGGNTGQPN